jgi:HEAT repeat protein
VHHADDQRFSTALDLALQDTDTSVRYFATGQTSRERAQPVLEALVRDATVDPKIRQHALRDCLDPPGDVRAVRALLDDALRSLSVRETAQEHLVRHADQVLIVEMCERIESEDDAWCLGLLGVLRERDLPPNLEARLIALLERFTPDLRVSAAFLLAKVGTAQAIDPLLARLGDPDYDEMARFAVRQIQARVGPVEAGRLSIASPAGPAGALTLAVEPGALSEAEVSDSSDDSVDS